MDAPRTPDFRRHKMSKLHPHYLRQEQKHLETVEGWWIAIKVLVVVAGLIKIFGG